MKLWNREPALTLAVVAAALNLAVGFGLPVSPEQVALLNALAVAVAGWVVRSRVTPA
jgi:hypothetical protein